MKQADKEGLLAKFSTNPPASPSSVLGFESKAGLHLPEDYVQFLEQTDGGEGFIGNAYVMLWRVDELFEMNGAYQVAEYAPGLLLFGSDGEAKPSLSTCAPRPNQSSRFRSSAWN